MKILRAIIAIAAIVISSLMATHPNTASASVMQQTAYSAPAFEVPDANNMSLLISMVHLSATPVTRITVKTGNTLTGIAREHRIGWQSLYCANKQIIGKNPDFIKPGERLIIPQHKVSCSIPRMEATVAPATTTAHYTAGSSNQSYNPPVSQGPSGGTAQQDAWNLLPSANKAAEYACLSNVIERESGWNIYATNPTTGAYGIPQALPGSKMAVAGSDWATSAYTQLLWMINYYIGPIYGDSCGAWNHEVAYGWY